jgi:hypothetical protein
MLVACGTTPSVRSAEPIKYGTTGVGPISADQTRVLSNCYFAGDAAIKIVELRSEGKSDDEIIKFYSTFLGKDSIQLIYDLLPIIAEDNPQAQDRIDYGLNLYGRCIQTQFNPKVIRIAEYCFQQNQFLNLAFAFRRSNKPMEMAYTKMNARGETKIFTDALLARAKEIDKAREGSFRLETYYGCLGHPEKAPNLRGQ